MSDPAPVVFVVDDDISVRECLHAMMSDAGWRVESFAAARQFLLRPRADGPSGLGLDVGLPDMNGLDLQALLADRTDMPIIFITGNGDVSVTVRAMKAGAVEFLTKPYRHHVILDAVRHALERSRAVLAHEAEMRRLRERYATLSPRERQVMALVVSGRLNKQVGGELGISEITVKAHRGKMMQKMNAGSLPDLVRMAVRLCVMPAVGPSAELAARPLTQTR